MTRLCNTVSPVVVGVDGSSRSEGALRYGAREAVLHGVPLLLVHVSPAVLSEAAPLIALDLHDIGRSILADARRLAREVEPGVVVHTQHYKGSRVAGLSAAARDARLVVLGRETRRGLDRLLSGATTAAVVAATEGAAVVVPAHWTAAQERHDRVVVGVKHGPGSAALLGAAFDAASERGATLVVVHAWHVPDAYFDRVEARLHTDRWVAQGTEMLEGLLAGWRESYPEVPVEIRVVHDRPAAGLAAASSDADLLVVVRRHRDALHPRALGGTTRALLGACEVPVEVVASGPPLPATPGLVLERDGELVR